MAHKPRHRKDASKSKFSFGLGVGLGILHDDIKWIVENWDSVVSFVTFLLSFFG